MKKNTYRTFTIIRLQRFLETILMLRIKSHCVCATLETARLIISAGQSLVKD